jgi:hypothetical protein
MIFLWVSGIKGIGTQSGEKKLVVVVVQEPGRSGRSGSDMATKTQPELWVAMDVRLPEGAPY